MNKVTYVCCWNDADQLQSMLLKSLPSTICPIVKENGINEAPRSLLLVNAVREKYSSAAAALNGSLQKYRNSLGDILIFVHQDIFFRDLSFEKAVITALEENSQQLVGMAGMSETGAVMSNLRYLKTDSYITKTQLRSPVEVASLDECCFAMTREVYEKIKFDERTCRHWHLYAVDFCYEARCRLGVRSKVIPCESVCHKYEEGGLYTDFNFLRTMWKLCWKYRHAVDMIYAPCYIVRTGMFAIGKICKTMARNVLKHRS